jgi:hypothetical protein
MAQAFEKVPGSEVVDPTTSRTKSTYKFADGSTAQLDDYDVAQMSSGNAPLPDEAFTPELGKVSAPGLTLRSQQAPVQPTTPVTQATAPTTIPTVEPAEETAPVDMPVTETPTMTAAPVAPGPSILTTTNSTVQSQGKAYDPALISKSDAEFAAYLDLKKKEHEASAKVAEADAKYAEAKSVEYTKKMEEEAIKQQADQAEVAKRLADVDAAVSKYDSMKLDSPNFWADRSTGDKVLALIGIAFSGLAQAKGVTDRNITMDAINAAIDRDIELQKYNIEKAGHALTQKRGVYQEFLKQTGDERLARMAARDAYLKGVELQFAAVGARANNDVVKAKSDALIQEAVATRAQNRADMEAVTKSSVTETKQHVVEAPKAEKVPPLPKEKTDKLEPDAAIIHSWGRLKDKLVNMDPTTLEKTTGALNIDPFMMAAYKQLNMEVPKDYSDLKSGEAAARFNFIKSMSGAGVGEGEMKRYLAFLPQFSTNPKVALSEMESLIDTSRANLRRLLEEEARDPNNPYLPSIMARYGVYLTPQDSKSKFRPATGK